jgi:hypothetical protein
MQFNHNYIFLQFFQHELGCFIMSPIPWFFRFMLYFNFTKKNTSSRWF